MFTLHGVDQEEKPDAVGQRRAQPCCRVPDQPALCGLVAHKLREAMQRAPGRNSTVPRGEPLGMGWQRPVTLGYVGPAYTASVAQLPI